jgi:hypothetical protein
MIGFLICALLLVILQIVTGWWWWIMVVPFAYFMVRRARMQAAIITGAAASGTVWLVWSLYMWLIGGADLIAERVAGALQIQQPAGLVFLVFLIAVIAGGLAAAAGASIRASVRRST